MKARVLAIIPAHNEASNLSIVIEDLRGQFVLSDILVVNDASSDETERAARNLGVRVLSLPFNLGIGGAVQTGLKYAEDEGYDIAVQFDGDGQHIAQEIPSLLAPVLEGQADMVVGSRYLEDRGYKTPLFRRMGMVFSVWLTSAVIRQKLTDITSGFRAWNSAAIKVFAQDYPMSFAGVESSITAHYCGLRLVEVPAHFRARFGGKSSINFWRSFYYPFKTVVAALGVVMRRSDHVQFVAKREGT
jgi:glycosyltransferase involved in cell wall biosynthesis